MPANERLKCPRCERPFVNDFYLANHILEHDREDQEKLDWEWEKQQRAKGTMTSEWRSPYYASKI